MTPDRLLPLVDAEHGLELRRPGFLTPFAIVKGEGVERLRVESPLVGQVEQAPALERREHLDFFHEGAPVPHVQPVQFPRCPAEYLRELEHQEGSLLDLERPGRVDALAEFIPQRAQRAREPEGVPGRLRQRQPVQEQPDRQELDQASFRHGVDHPIAALLEESHHARPAAQGQEGGREEVVPLPLVHAEGVEGLPDRLQGADVPVFEAAELLGQPAQPAVGWPAGRAVQRAEGAVEPLVPSGELPVGQALVQERPAEADQDVMDQQVGVNPRRQQEQVAVPQRQQRGQREVGDPGDTVTAHPP